MAECPGARVNFAQVPFLTELDMSDCNLHERDVADLKKCTRLYPHKLVSLSIVVSGSWHFDPSCLTSLRTLTLVVFHHALLCEVATSLPPSVEEVSLRLSGTEPFGMPISADVLSLYGKVVEIEVGALEPLHEVWKHLTSLRKLSLSNQAVSKFLWRLDELESRPTLRTLVLMQSNFAIDLELDALCPNLASLCLSGSPDLRFCPGRIRLDELRLVSSSTVSTDLLAPGFTHLRVLTLAHTDLPTARWELPLLEKLELVCRKPKTRGRLPCAAGLKSFCVRIRCALTLAGVSRDCAVLDVMYPKLKDLSVLSTMVFVLEVSLLLQWRLTSCTLVGVELDWEVWSEHAQDTLKTLVVSGHVVEMTRRLFPDTVVSTFRLDLPTLGPLTLRQ